MYYAKAHGHEILMNWTPSTLQNCDGRRVCRDDVRWAARQRAEEDDQEPPSRMRVPSVYLQGGQYSYSPVGAEIRRRGAREEGFHQGQPSSFLAACRSGGFAFAVGAKEQWPTRKKLAGGCLRSLAPSPGGISNYDFDSIKPGSKPWPFRFLRTSGASVPPTVWAKESIAVLPLHGKWSSTNYHSSRRPDAHR